MSKCSFTIPFKGLPETIINKAKSAIQGQGGSFNGDDLSGNFSVQVLGNISGTYSIAGNEMTVDIDSKPLFIGCGQIESFMRNQFGK